MISGKKDDVENPRESVYIRQRGLPLRFFLFLKLLSLNFKVSIATEVSDTHFDFLIFCR